MNPIYEERRRKTREKAERIRAYISIKGVPAKEKKALLEDLEREARRNGLINEFKENGYL